MAQIFDTPLFSSDQSIDRVLKTGIPAALVFLGSTDQAALDQTLKALAKQHAGQLLVVQMNTKDSPETARKFNVRATPALVTVKNGQLYSQAGSITAADLEKHVNYLLGKGPRPEPAAAQRETARPAQPANGYGQAAGAGQPVVVTDATFEQEVMRSPVPVVVDFWAPWCGPCRMVAPVLDKLAREWAGRVKIAKINVDENPMVAGRQGVQAIPTMMVVKDGKIADRWAGALPEPSMRSRLSGILGV